MHLSIAIIEYAVPFARWAVTVFAGLLFVLCALGNWSLLIRGIVGLVRGKELTFSLVLPFLGPLFGLVFFFVIPIPGFRPWWWLSMLVEPTWLAGAYVFVTSRFLKRGGRRGARS